jgi:glycosyltransferase involved in cell wall biosynthesis
MKSKVSSIPVSVIILTKNEERDLPECLHSLQWCNDVHLVDSHSSDATCEIARRSGIKVEVNHFLSFGVQRNWALDNCRILHPWVLFLDADERTTPEMVSVMTHTIAEASEEIAGFYCCWKLMMGNRWLKRSDNFPKWQFRLLRKDRARFTDFGHGQKEGVVDGEIHYLKEPYLHCPFLGTWNEWEAKHRRYAQQEAVARRQHPLKLSELLSSHASKRNPALKLLLSKLPGWPSLRFIYTYVLRGGFLEGKEGLLYCQKIRWYEAEIMQRMKAAEARTSGS